MPTPLLHPSSIPQANGQRGICNSPFFVAGDQPPGCQFCGEEYILCKEFPPTYNGVVYDSAGHFQIIFPNHNPNLCDTSLILDLRFPNETAPKITCLIDSFLNAVALKWETIELAEQYEIKVNGIVKSIQTHTSMLYFPNSSGDDLEIMVEPSNARGCHFPIGTITCKSPKTVSNQEITPDNQIAVFPNPSSGIFEIFSKYPLREIEVLDFSGKPVFKNSEFKNERIDLSENSSGIYFLKIKNEKGVFIKKVLLQK